MPPAETLSPPTEAGLAPDATTPPGREVPGLISTVITSYNKAPYLPDAIESALAQDYPHQEVLVVDDGSTDATRVVAASYGDRVRYIHQENRGCPASKNTGIRAARGEFVALLDGDDRWRPGKLVKQVSLLRGRPELGLVYTDRIKFAGDRVVWASNWDRHTPRRGWVLDHLLVDNFVPVSSVVARRRCLFEAGLFNEQQRVASDFDLWLRFARLFQVDYVDEILMEYRLGIDSIGSRVRTKFTHVMAIQERFLAEHYGGRYPDRRVVARATAARYCSLGDYRLSEGDHLLAVKAYLRAARADPLGQGHLRRVARGVLPNRLAGRLKGLLRPGGARHG